MSLFNLVVVGCGGVGKSCVTIQFIAERDPTIEDRYHKQVTVDDETCVLDIFDTAGQEEFSTLSSYYMRSGDGFINSFEEVQKLYDFILRVKDTNQVPFVMVGNKTDLEAQRKVSKKEAEELAATRGYKYIECSAKTGENIQEIFVELVRQVRENQKKKKQGAIGKYNKKDAQKAKKLGSSPSMDLPADPDEDGKKKVKCLLL